MFNNTNVEFYKNASYVDLIKIIDKNYYEAKKQKISRMTNEWYGWSRAMNIATRERINSNSVDVIRLKYVFSYWQTISQLLDLHFQGKLRNLAKIKRKSKEASDLKELILSGELNDLSMDDLVQKDLKNTLTK